jgi:hypothetical protein
MSALKRRATTQREFPTLKARIRMGAVRVLCVENHPEYMGALKYMLERVGYEVTPATYWRAGSAPVDNSAGRGRSPGIPPARCYKLRCAGEPQLDVS